MFYIFSVLYFVHGRDCDKSVVIAIFLVCDSDFRIRDCHFDFSDCDDLIYDCYISSILRYHITYNLFIISRALHSLLLIAAMNAHTITSLIHNFADKSIPEACLHSFNIVSTISGTSVQGA